MSMNLQEQKEFLTQSRCIAKISTIEKDGGVHIAPVWYLYDGKNFIATSDANSYHVKNLRRNAKASMLIDTTQFPTKGVRLKGSATMNENSGNVHNYEVAITRRYIPDEKKAQEYVRKRESKSKRLAIIIIPDKISSWDFSKDKEEKEFFKDKPVYSLNDR